VSGCLDRGYPVTNFGKIVSGAMMFATIGFFWTFVGLLGSTIVSSKAKAGERKGEGGGSL
jgi:hypothetical protein